MNNSKARILISGAGLGGLTAGLALLKRGFDIEIFEQANHLREVGAGIQISSNGSRVLYELGLQNLLEPLACKPEGKEIRLWNTGQTWKLFDLGAQSMQRYGYPYLMVHRADLLNALACAIREIKPDAIQLGHKALQLSEDSQGVTLHFENGQKARGHLLIGADGIHSKIRQAMFGAATPKFTGCMAWRGLIPAAALPSGFQRKVGTNWVGPGAHVIHYPIRDGEMINFVGIVERDDWQVESWTQQGTREECAADFPDWHEDVQALISHIDTPYKWALMGREPMATWSQGRTTLLGDACHPTLPFLAQGAMMAIEDGLVLARCLEHHYPDTARAFERYEALRMQRTSKIVTGSSENAKRFHNPALATAEGANDYVKREWDQERVNERYSWLFEYDASTVNVE